MDLKQKFEYFLESLKGHGHDVLIENVKNGFNVCLEADWSSSTNLSSPERDYDIPSGMSEFEYIVDKEKSFSLGTELLKIPEIMDKIKSEYGKDINLENLDIQVIMNISNIKTKFETDGEYLRLISEPKKIWTISYLIDNDYSTEFTFTDEEMEGFGIRDEKVANILYTLDDGWWFPYEETMLKKG